MAEREPIGVENLAVIEVDKALATEWKPRQASSGDIERAARRAAETACAVLYLDERRVEDVFIGQLEAMSLSAIDVEKRRPIPSINIGSKDMNGQLLTPQRIIEAHDYLHDSEGNQIWPAEMIYDEDFYPENNYAWWNKARVNGESQLIEEPLRIVWADIAVRGIDRSWRTQQEQLNKFIRHTESLTVTIEAIRPLDWLMLDVDALCTDTERPDTYSLTRFVQYELTGQHGDWGPCAETYELHGRELAELSVDLYPGTRRPGVGFRTIAGLKQLPDCNLE